jgi:hypothetical protein
LLIFASLALFLLIFYLINYILINLANYKLFGNNYNNVTHHFMAIYSGIM